MTRNKVTQGMPDWLDESVRELVLEPTSAVAAALADALEGHPQFVTMRDATLEAAQTVRDLRAGIPQQITEKLSQASTVVEAAGKAAVVAVEAAVRPYAVRPIRREGAVWIWDPANGSHYLLPDASEALIARPSLAPLPTTKPELNW